jgi:hypothetical protein
MRACNKLLACGAFLGSLTMDWALSVNKPA